MSKISDRPHARTVPQRMLIDDIRAGGILRRRGQGPDQNYWLGGGRVYIRSHRSTADALVRYGVARWATCENQKIELATHYLVLEVA